MCATQRNIRLEAPTSDQLSPSEEASSSKKYGRRDPFAASIYHPFDGMLSGSVTDIVLPEKLTVVFGNVCGHPSRSSPKRKE
jgi:hypothetical protein